MEKETVQFRSKEFSKIAVLSTEVEKDIVLCPEQHNLLLLLSTKKSGKKYNEIPKQIFEDILEMYNFL